MSISEDLKKVRKLLDSPEKWAQGTMFSDDGKACCLTGATTRVAYGDPYNSATICAGIRLELNRALRKAIRSTGSRASGIETWNDWHGRRHADVLNVIDIAIEGQQQ